MCEQGSIRIHFSKHLEGDRVSASTCSYLSAKKVQLAADARRSAAPACPRPSQGGDVGPGQSRDVHLPKVSDLACATRTR